jgi:hypothetical protein
MESGFFELHAWGADDIQRLFVDAQPKEGRMPHLAFTRPLGEFGLTPKLGNKPSATLSL